MSVYVGIDVHRRRSQVAVINQGGEVLANRNVPNGVKPVLSVIGDLPAGTPAAYEAAFGWEWLPELLEGLRLRAAHGPPAAVQGDRLGAAEERQGPVRQRSRSCWSGPGRQWLASLQLPAVSREVTGDALALTGALQQPAGGLDAEVRQRAKAGPRVKVLTWLPGVGPFTALVLLAETGDITRFGSARKLASWAGLTPTVRGSDRTVRHGHISKQGPAWVRWVTCEAAQTAKRHPDFAPGYEATARRRGKKIATTAVARKLITRACHLLTDAASGGAPG